MPTKGKRHNVNRRQGSVMYKQPHPFSIKDIMAAILVCCTSACKKKIYYTHSAICRIHTPDINGDNDPSKTRSHAWAIAVVKSVPDHTTKYNNRVPSKSKQMIQKYRDDCSYCEFNGRSWQSLTI